MLHTFTIIVNQQEEEHMHDAYMNFRTGCSATKYAIMLKINGPF